jgi:hypothetical protein
MAPARKFRPQKAAPSPSTMTVIASMMMKAEAMRATTYAQRGSGVPCMRLSTPWSRRIAVPMARLTKVVAMMP